jgi:hypothetical protein
MRTTLTRMANIVRRIEGERQDTRGRSEWVLRRAYTWLPYDLAHLDQAVNHNRGGLLREPGLWTHRIVDFFPFSGLLGMVLGWSYQWLNRNPWR